MNLNGLIDGWMDDQKDWWVNRSTKCHRCQTSDNLVDETEEVVTRSIFYINHNIYIQPVVNDSWLFIIHHHSSIKLFDIRWSWSWSTPIRLQAVRKTKISPMIDFCRRNNAQPTYFASFFLANAPDIIRRTVKYRPELYKIWLKLFFLIRTSLLGQALNVLNFG